MIIEHKPPAKRKRSVFLAGTIDMGSSEDWQKKVVQAIKAHPDLKAVIYNPRRKAWDNSWSQSIENPVFKEQVDWELEHIEVADVVAFNILPNSKSPIALLELGYVAARNPHRAVVLCPDPFYRKGNVDIMCHRYGIVRAKNFDDFVSLIIQKIKNRV